ncbi:DUF4219 domain-containing protein [Tanacetum coccineum]
MATKEAKDLATHPFNEIIGNLKVYEMILENDGVASKTTKEKVKTLTLKAKVTREQTSDDNDSQGGSDEDVNKEESEALNLMERNFQKFFRNGNRFGSGNRFTNESNRFRRGRGNNFRTKEVKAQDKSKVATFAWKKVTSLVSVQFLKRTRLLSEELRVIVKMVCLKCDILTDNWIVDSGCTKHMIGNRRFFTLYKAYDGGYVTFRSKIKGKVIGGGNISHDSIITTNVEHVSDLAFNMISVGYPKSVEEARGHSIEQVIGELSERTIRTYVKGMKVRQHCCFNKMKDTCEYIIQTMVDIVTPPDGAWTEYVSEGQESCEEVSSCTPIKIESKGNDHEKSIYLATIPLNELIGKLKVYEMILENDGVASTTTKEKVKSLALKAKNNIFGRGNRFGNGANRFGRGCGTSFGNKGGESSRQNRGCNNWGEEGHFISECPKPKENKAFIRGALSDSEDDNEPQNNATCLMEFESQEVLSKPSRSNNDLDIIDFQKENKERLSLDRSMDSDKYLEGQSMQRPPLFESDSFIYWKNRFETYVKSKDLDLWHVITNGDFQPIVQNPETKLDEVIPFEKQTDDLKKRLAKNNEAKMVIYNALPRKEYERIFMCNTAKEIWKNLLITHQGNSQVKDNKIDLLVQQYEQFVISEDESIDSAFARFNTIITSLKSLDEGYSSKNYVRKFLRACSILHDRHERFNRQIR